MPKPNYAFAKRQRELAKKQKQEEKRQRKAEHGGPSQDPLEGAAPDDEVSPAADGPAAGDSSRTEDDSGGR
ncbi:MAG: hypothetical protein AB7L76_22140 [Burkholderiaceae bacterium]